MISICKPHLFYIIEVMIRSTAKTIILHDYRLILLLFDLIVNDFSNNYIMNINSCNINILPTKVKCVKYSSGYWSSNYELTDCLSCVDLSQCNLNPWMPPSCNRSNCHSWQWLFLYKPLVLLILKLHRMCLTTAECFYISTVLSYSRGKGLWQYEHY